MYILFVVENICQPVIHCEFVSFWIVTRQLIIVFSMFQITTIARFKLSISHRKYIIRLDQIFVFYIGFKYSFSVDIGLTRVELIFKNIRIVSLIIGGVLKISR